MKFNLSKIKYSKNDLRLNIHLPSFLTPKLAHFLGIHVGDGHMNVNRRPGKVDYYLAYHGHKVDEYSWYVHYITPLIKELFNKKITPRTTKKGTVMIEFRSLAIVDFLARICKLPVGPKTNCHIPSIIMRAPKHIQFAFLKGLADTDFSVIFRKRKSKNDYPVIFYQTPNQNLVQEVIEILRPLSLKVSQGVRYQKRNGKSLKGCYLQISGRESLKIWMKKIGFSSSKHVNRIKIRGLLEPT